MKLIYPAIFTPCEELSGYTVEVPDLPGCVTEGRTMEEAMEMAIDAASGWILGELEDGCSYPSPSKYGSVTSPDDGFVSMLLLDMDQYAEKYGDKSVRCNVTVPAWLSTSSKKKGLNLSQVLQEALMQKLQE